MEESCLDMVSHVEEGNTRKKSKITRNLLNIMEQLPHEILVQIISKLPASTILNCCNPLPNISFYNLISDPMFRSLFESNKFTSFLACEYNHTNKVFKVSLIDYNQEDGYFSKLSMINTEGILGTRCNAFRVVASCNGWLLVYSSLTPFDNAWIQTLSLVNPITRQCVVLPDSIYSYSERRLVLGRANYGLGYSSKTGQLNVVTFFNRVFHPRGYVAKVFVVGGDGGWEIIRNYSGEMGIIQKDAGAAALNGALHWLVVETRQRLCVAAGHHYILRYDIDHKKFDHIPTPPTTMTISSSSTGDMGVLQGMLCVGKHECDPTTRSTTRVDIWVMKEYGVEKSWTRFTTIDYYNDPKQYIMEIPVLKNGKLLTLSRDIRDQKIYVGVYDPTKRQWDQQRIFLSEGFDKDSRICMIARHLVPNFLYL